LDFWRPNKKKNKEVPPNMTISRIAIASALMGVLGAAHGHEGQSDVLEELVVYARAQQMLGVAESASEGIVGYDDITIPPMLRVGELVEAVPGMVATQHSGTGKANQYFLRGFNLDHGTDFSAFANGVPINMRTHGHGQGYLDLNFLIPELVATTSYRKGPYSPHLGDFSSAGSVSFEYFDRLEESMIQATVGDFDYYRGLLATSIDAGDGAFTGVLDHSSYSGPWELDEDLSATKFYAAYAGHLGDKDARIALSGYSGEWNSTDQIPRRAVQSGDISQLGYIDPDLGGNTDRYELSGSITGDKWHWTAYVVDYDFNLFSNFTYNLENPIQGDEFEQVDDRTIFGTRVDGEREISGFSKPLKFGWGGDIRYDNIREVGLYPTVARQRTGTVREDSVDQFSASAFGDLHITLTERLRVSAGLRADYMDWDVSARLSENSGSGNDAILSPKLNLAYRAADWAELYVNWGRGFHSNDVRGLTITVDPVTGDPIDPVDTYARSDGAEIGVRVESGETFNATLTLFTLELDSELLFVGDAGNTEVQGGTRRNGVEFSTFWQPIEWLAATLSYTYTDAEYVEDQDPGREIPGAIESVASLGINGTWNNGLFASIRGRYLGSAPLVEDGSISSDSSFLLNASVGWQWNNFEFRVDGFNLLDSDDDDIAYYYASRLAGEPLAGVEDVHFHPLEPRMVRASVTMHW
jgi:outer membrane receptor for ferrienterochelin and colicin